MLRCMQRLAESGMLRNAESRAEVVRVIECCGAYIGLGNVRNAELRAWVGRVWNAAVRT